MQAENKEAETVSLAIHINGWKEIEVTKETYPPPDGLANLSTLTDFLVLPVLPV